MTLIDRVKKALELPSPIETLSPWSQGVEYGEQIEHTRTAKLVEALVEHVKVTEDVLAEKWLLTAADKHRWQLILVSSLSKLESILEEMERE